MTNDFKRQVAKICSIASILSSRYVKEEGWEPNYIETSSGSRISRVNLLGVVVAKEDAGKALIMDDSTGKIRLVWFEDDSVPGEIDIGSVVLVIGRPREYQNEKYVLPEIIRRVDNPGWLTVRKLLLNKEEEPSSPSIHEEAVEAASQTNAYEKIIDMIRTNDAGSGVERNHVLESVPDGEHMIEELLKEGELFEVRPGRLKVLE